MVTAYLSRWKVEESIRFLKQSYQLEDIRLTWVGPQNMMALVTAAAYFTMAYLGLKTKLLVLMRHLLKAAKRVFGIPEFLFYALAGVGSRSIPSPENGASRARIYSSSPPNPHKNGFSPPKIWGNFRQKKVLTKQNDRDIRKTKNLLW